MKACDYPVVMEPFERIIHSDTDQNVFLIRVELLS